MRNQNDMLNSFMPKHEKEWESRLFVDKAVKASTEYHLEAIARALGGKYEIKTSMAQDDRLFENTEHICGDDSTWIKVTKKYKWEAKFDAYIFYANSKTGLWLQIIDFWAGRQSIFPCGAASFPNHKAEVSIDTGS